METKKKEFLNKMGNRFEEIKMILSTKESEWTKQIDDLFKTDMDSHREFFFKKKAKKTLKEINQIEPFKLSEKTSRTMDSIESFLEKLEQCIIKEEEPAKEQLPVPSINLSETTPKPSIIEAETVHTLLLTQEESLFISVKNSNPIDFPINPGELKKIKRVKIELERYQSLLPESGGFDFLSKTLRRLNHYTCISVSFAPEGLTDHHALNLLSLLFSRIQHLTEIKLSFERCQITDQSLLAFCIDILSGARSLKSLTLKLGSTLISDLGLFALAESLSSQKHLECFTLEIGSTAITDDGIERVFHSVLGVKELNLQLQGTLVTDRCLNVLGNHMMMSCMKNLEKLTLNGSDTPITIGGVTAVLTEIPKNIKWLNLDFCHLKPTDDVIFLFTSKVHPKLELVEDIHVRLGGTDLTSMQKSLKVLRMEAEKKKKARQ